ncbi:MAG: sigma-70 family RNA polymerase sigma factor [Aminipila sp.]
MKITEENFILQLKMKDEKALEFIIEKYGWIIKSVARKHLQQTPELVDECLNDVLFAIWQNIDSFDKNKNTFENWLAGVSRYKAIDCKRKYLKRLNEEPLEAAENIPDIECNLSILQEEITEEIKEILSCLSPQDRGIFERLFWEEESVKSISSSMGIKETAVYNHVSRGRKKIREYLPLIRRGSNL